MTRPTSRNYTPLPLPKRQPASSPFVGPFPPHLTAEPPAEGYVAADAETIELQVLTPIAVRRFTATKVVAEPRSIKIHRHSTLRAKGRLPAGRILVSDSRQRFCDQHSDLAGIILERLGGEVVFRKVAGNKLGNPLPAAEVWPHLFDLAREWNITNGQMEDFVAGEMDALEALQAAALASVIGAYDAMSPREVLALLARVATEKSIPSFTKQDSRSPLALAIFERELGDAVGRLGVVEIRDLLAQLLPESEPEPEPEPTESE